MTSNIAARRQVLPARSHGWNRARLGVGLLWAVLAVAAIVVGERTSSLAALEAALDSGHVDTVTVAGGLPAGARGFATQQVRWEGAITTHVTEVVQARHSNAAGAASQAPVLHQPSPG